MLWQIKHKGEIVETVKTISGVIEEVKSWMLKEGWPLEFIKKCKFHKLRNAQCCGENREI